MQVCIKTGSNFPALEILEVLNHGRINDNTVLIQPLYCPEQSLTVMSCRYMRK